MDVKQKTSFDISGILDPNKPMQTFKEMSYVVLKYKYPS